MTAYFLYLIEASICLGLLYIIYLLFLKEETFYRLNRFYLLGSIIVSLIIPALPQPEVVKSIPKPNTLHTSNSLIKKLKEDNFSKAISDFTTAAEVRKQSSGSFPVNTSIFILYLMGVSFFLFRLLNNLLSLFRHAHNKDFERISKYKIIPLNGDLPTFSFLTYIFLNDKNITDREKHDILLHETTHLKQLHSLDILFLELYKIVFWFNPLAWQIKKSLIKIHECLADEAIVKSSPEKINSYQSTLLNQYLSNINIELAHPFNYSLIKFRIKMMTKTKSKWWAKYKTAFAVPVLLMTIFAFTKENSTLTKSRNELKRIAGFSTNPSRWFLAGSNYRDFEVTMDEKIAYNGKKSARIDSKIQDPPGFTTLMQRCNVLKFRGKRIKMTGFIKSEGVQDTAMMWIRVDDYDKRITADFDNMYNRPVVGKKDWTRCEIIFDVPESNCELYFGVIMVGAGKVWFDDVNFEIVPDYINKTSANIGSPLSGKYIQDIIESNPFGIREKEPGNLNFEE